MYPNEHYWTNNVNRIPEVMNLPIYPYTKPIFHELVEKGNDRPGAICPIIDNIIANFPVILELGHISMEGLLNIRPI